MESVTQPPFSYSNLNPRPPGRFVTVLRRILPGVGRVADQTAPYAAAWHEHNIDALGRTGPLWVALGDSISQGIGASSVGAGWVPQAAGQLRERGHEFRVVNLSISGARVADVIDRQLPALAGLGANPELVTIFIGSNDVIRREYRHDLPATFGRLLTLLPAGTLVATIPLARGVLATLGALVERTPTVVAVPVAVPRGARADDHFHPNDYGYTVIANAFVAAILADG